MFSLCRSLGGRETRAAQFGRLKKTHSRTAGTAQSSVTAQMFHNVVPLDYGRANGAAGYAAFGAGGPARVMVKCNDNLMYGVRMKSLCIAGTRLKIDKVVRHRTRDGKVVPADMMVASGYSPKMEHAVVTLANLMHAKDDKLEGLDSLELDSDSLDAVYSHTDCMYSLDTAHIHGTH